MTSTAVMHRWSELSPIRNGFLKQGSRIVFIFIFGFATLSLPSVTATLTDRPNSGHPNFSVFIQDKTISYKTFSIFLLPGEKVHARVISSRDGKIFSFNLLRGSEGILSVDQWSWTAPKESGIYPLLVAEPLTQDSMLINLIVMVPAQEIKKGSLHGYSIGQYPHGVNKYGDLYKPPVGFIQVTQENAPLLVSPHFTLGQFVCKQEGDYPKYIVLQEKLLFKLEAILEAAQKCGIAKQTLTIMSAYRTPHYNQLLQNVAFSRHLWGDAADVYIDEQPHDGVMDDLNRDGRIDIQDSYVLANLVDGLNKSHQELRGGLGTYRPSNTHGAFVHVDVRGFDATW